MGRCHRAWFSSVTMTRLAGGRHFQCLFCVRLPAGNHRVHARFIQVIVKAMAKIQA
jgi:hypothetical protein